MAIAATIDLHQGVDQHGRKFGYVSGDGGGYFFTWHKTLGETVASLEEDAVDGDGGLTEMEAALYLLDKIKSHFDTNLESMVDLLDETPGAAMFIVGMEDTADVAQSWLDAGFTIEDVSDWWDAGCWDADRTALLRDAGLTPEQVATTAPASVLEGRSWGYAHSNGDVSTEAVVAEFE